MQNEKIYGNMVHEILFLGLLGRWLFSFLPVTSFESYANNIKSSILAIMRQTAIHWRQTIFFGGWSYHF